MEKPHRASARAAANGDSGVFERADARPRLVVDVKVQQIARKLRGKVIADALRVIQRDLQQVPVDPGHVVAPSEVHPGADRGVLTLVEANDELANLGSEHRLQRQVERNLRAKALQSP
jgi:hypothetical protein